MRLNGETAYTTYWGDINKEKFTEYLKNIFIPTLHKGDNEDSGYFTAFCLISVIGERSERSIYCVLDNMMLRINGMKQPKNWKDALAEFLAESGAMPTL